MKYLNNILRVHKELKVIREYSKKIVKDFTVQKYGVFNAEHKGVLTISPIDPIAYPDQTTAKVYFRADDLDHKSLQATYDASKSHFFVNNTDVEIDAQLPVKYGKRLHTSKIINFNQNLIFRSESNFF